MNLTRSLGGLLCAVLLGACSSTTHYRASGYFAMTDSGGLVSSHEQAQCEGQANVACTPYVMEWESERYCGIYKKADDRATSRRLRLGTSPTTITDWKDRNGETVLQADDGEFEDADGQVEAIGTDILCARFRPPVEMIDIRAGQFLGLEVLCRPLLAGINLMPASATPYPLAVEIVSIEKSWLGCK